MCIIHTSYIYIYIYIHIHISTPFLNPCLALLSRKLDMTSDGGNLAAESAAMLSVALAPMTCKSGSERRANATRALLQKLNERRLVEISTSVVVRSQTLASSDIDSLPKRSLNYYS